MNLYRGYHRELHSSSQENIFYDGSREPLHCSREVHEHADSWFLQKFGVAARSSCLICTTDFEQAVSYGYPYRIVPQGPAKIIYSSSVKDFLQYDLDLVSDSESDVWEWLERQRYEMVQRQEDIHTVFKGEVMVYCKYYSAVPLRS